MLPSAQSCKWPPLLPYLQQQLLSTYSVRSQEPGNRSKCSKGCRADCCSSGDFLTTSEASLRIPVGSTYPFTRYLQSNTLGTRPQASHLSHRLSNPCATWLL